MITNDLALALVVLKVLGEQIKTGKALADSEIRAGARPEDRTAALLPDGTKVGTVNLNNGRMSAKVTDRDMFTQWALHEYPTEVEQVPTVRPSFEKRLLDHCKKTGVAVTVDGDEIPGVEVSAGDPYPMVKLTEAAPDAVAAAYRSGRLDELMARFTRPELASGGGS